MTRRPQDKQLADLEHAAALARAKVRDATMREPGAFLSYARKDDKHDRGRISRLRERLSSEVDLQIGRGFPIFQDRENITWGQEWKSRIEGAIDSATFFIPIITPAFFRSQACCKELKRFLERERKLGRNDLILPIYYVECAEIEDAGKNKPDALVKAIRNHQGADWRSLRLASESKIRKAIADLARQIKDAISRSG